MRASSGQASLPVGIAAGDFRRVQREVAPVDPALWLHSRRDALRILWRDRDGGRAVAGSGALALVQRRNAVAHAQPARVDQIRQTLDPDCPDLRWFGGFAFEDSPISGIAPWQPFGVACFALPRFELVREGRRALVAVNFRRGEESLARKLLDRLARAAHPLADAETPPPPTPAVIARADEPDAREWRQRAALALRSIWGGEMEKVVLARRTILTLEHPLDPILLSARLASAEPDAFHFLFRPRAGLAFLCASPERLYRREGRTIDTEAVAGTRPRGRGSGEDEALSRELASSDKESREHRSVREMVAGVLRDLCVGFREVAREELFRSSRVQHLRTRFSGMLRHAISDDTILQNLHPTPAVAGLPREDALEQIAILEPFHRGWYAGPVGWISADATEFAVAIRSALVRQSSIELYAGAGLVLDSDPAAEWGELEDKIRVFMEILGAL